MIVKIMSEVERKIETAGVLKMLERKINVAHTTEDGTARITARVLEKISDVIRGMENMILRKDTELNMIKLEECCKTGKWHSTGEFPAFIACHEIPNVPEVKVKINGREEEKVIDKKEIYAASKLLDVKRNTSRMIGTAAFNLDEINMIIDALSKDNDNTVSTREGVACRGLCSTCKLNCRARIEPFVEPSVESNKKLSEKEFRAWIFSRFGT